MSSAVRKWLGDISYPTRIAIWFSVIFMFGMIAVFCILYFLTARELRREDHLLIENKFGEISRMLESSPRSEWNEGLARMMAREGENELAVRLMRPDQGIAFEYLYPGLDEFSLSQFDTLAPSPDTADRRWLTLPSIKPGEDEILEVLRGRVADGYWLDVGRSSDEREDVLEDARETLAWVLLAIVLIGALGGTLLTNRAIAPVRDVIETVKSVKRGDISARVPRGNSKDEVETLKTLFNGMLDQIQNLIEGIRQTTDGVAHDLKTPLTRIRAHAELGLAEGASASAREEALAATIEGIDEIQTLLDSLFEVTETEKRTTSPKIETISLDAIFRQIGDLYGFIAEENGVALELREPHLAFLGDEIRIKRAVANLVDNALKYTPRGGSVEVSGFREGDAVLIEVRDTGPGIPEREIPHIWNRLYRGDKSRSKPGKGLGLSLVKAIAELHGGTVRVSSRRDQGSIFTISLPQAGA